MKHATVTLWGSGGVSWTTRFNGTPEEAIDYFFGKQFNLKDDEMTTVVKMAYKPAEQDAEVEMTERGPQNHDELLQAWLDSERTWNGMYDADEAEDREQCLLEFARSYAAKHGLRVPK